jgi:Zn-dependent peptidase ImmA (M78 family)
MSKEILEAAAKDYRLTMPDSGHTRITALNREFSAHVPVDIGRIAREHEIGFLERKLNSDIDVKLVRNEKPEFRSGFAIIVNSRNSDVWKRFAIAHALAHYQIGNRRARQEYSCRLRRQNERDRFCKTIEDQADRIALDLIVPGTEFAKRKGMTVAALALEFRVPDIVLERRMPPSKRSMIVRL